MKRRLPHRNLAVVVIIATAVIAPSCGLADDGLRVLRGGLRQTTPMVKSLPKVADDSALGAAALRYLESNEVDQSVLQRARQLASDEYVKALVKYTCNLTGVSTADPDDIVSEFKSIAEAASQNDSYGILKRDAEITAQNVQEQSVGSAAMNGAASLSVVIFQKVYC